MQPAAAIVNLLTETQTIKVCSHCEQEFGTVRPEPGQSKTNGLCRRHTLAVADSLPPEQKAEFIARCAKHPDSVYCPDMSLSANEAQLAVRLPSKQDVAGSIPVIRSTLAEAAKGSLQLVLTTASRAKLLQHVPAIHPRVYAHHVTLSFGDGSDAERQLLGRELTVNVTGAASDTQGQAVYVEIDVPCVNRYPHITVSVAEDSNPAYSNDLLKRGWEDIEPFQLTGTVSLEPL